MRWLLLALGAIALGAIALCGQTSQTYQFDGDGNRIQGPSVVVQGNSRRETVQSINGRNVPLETVDQKVIRSEGAVTVVERVTRRFDQTGHLSEVERVVEEQTKASDGSSTRATHYRSDVNGNMQVAERSVTQTRVSGSTETTESAIERPSISGSFQIAEKKQITLERSAARDRQDTVIYLADANGGFREAAKESVDRMKAENQAIENTARYAIGTSGQLELVSQTVRTATKKGGVESIVEDVFTSQSPGLANGADSKLRLKEQHVIERRQSNGGINEVVSIREPSLGDPDRLGPARKVRETVCSGKCDP